MGKKKKQKPKKQKPKKQSKKKKRQRVDFESSGGSSSSSNEDDRPRGMMSGMRSGMTDVAKGDSKWLDIFLWGLVILALCALAYRMGWLKDPNKQPQQQTQQRKGLRVNQARMKVPVRIPKGRIGVQPPSRRLPAGKRPTPRISPRPIPARSAAPTPNAPPTKRR